MCFKIVVCVKQVPDTNDIKWTENNTIQREGLDSIINPYDVSAIQLALQAKQALINQNIKAETIVVSMGPNQATQVLKTALSFGIDKAYLLSDKKFSAADTLATAYTLAQFVKNHVSDAKLIICGQQAIDGDTAQTPTSLAEKLSIGQVTNVKKLNEINNTYALIEQDTDRCTKTIKSGYPLLIATKSKDTIALPNINGYIYAQDSDVTILNADDINADYGKIGLKGSPTKVKKSYSPDIKRNTLFINSDNNTEIAKYLLNEIQNCRS